MSQAILFLKSHVDGYTRRDGAYVQPHEDKRQAARPTRLAGDKLGKVHYLVHPKKGHVPGKNVMVPHPEHPDKKVLGKYMGQHEGESVVHHDKMGPLLVHNDHVHPARGVPKQDGRSMERAADEWHAAHARRTEA